MLNRNAIVESFGLPRKPNKTIAAPRSEKHAAPDHGKNPAFGSVEMVEKFYSSNLAAEMNIDLLQGRRD